MSRLVLGDIEIIHLCAGRFRLDGGAMFGVVPKPLWETPAPPDERNRIEMKCNCLLVRTGDELVLIDTGLGDSFTPKEQDLFGVDPDIRLLAALAGAGFQPDQITQVVLTHLHFDHVGGALRHTAAGLQPTFPRATYAIQQGEWDDALQGRSIMKTSYQPENLKILERSGQIRFIQGDVDLGSGISTFITGGHTEYHQGIFIRADGQTLVYPSELIPTRAHLPPYWNMAYDMFPYQTLTRKRELLQQAWEQNWIVAWNHDPQRAWSRVRREGSHFIAIDLEDCSAT